MADPIKPLDSLERVALDLAIKIRADDATHDEAYWLGLFSRALKVVRGTLPSEVLTPKK